VSFSEGLVLTVHSLTKDKEFIVVIGCLLHDVGKFDTEIGIDHGRVSANAARNFLNTLNL